MPETTAPPPRVTIQRITALCAHYARMLRLAGWRFVCSVVPGLKHQGSDAWAVVDPDAAERTARVMVRDIDVTPIPDFDGDPMLEIRVTVAHELLHCVVADAMRGAGGVLTVPAEEQIVETAAQAMVRSEGLDARVMARAVRALPTALRARVAASAGQRARGGQMDPEKLKKLIEAIKNQDGAAALVIAEELLVEAASGGAAAHVEPDGDEPPKLSTDPALPGAVVATDLARRAKEAGVMDQDRARARKAADEAEAVAAELKAMAAHQRPAQKEALVVRLRARLGGALKPASEKRIMDAPTFTAAQEIAAVIEETIGDVSGSERARSGVEHEALPPPKTHNMPSADTLRTEGFTESWLIGYGSALRSGPDVAAAFLEQGRTSLRARTAQNGSK